MLAQQGHGVLWHSCLKLLQYFQAKLNLLNRLADHLFWHEYALVLISFFLLLLVLALGARYEVNKHVGIE